MKIPEFLAANSLYDIKTHFRNNPNWLDDDEAIDNFIRKFYWYRTKFFINIREKDKDKEAIAQNEIKELKNFFKLQKFLKDNQ